MDKQKRNYLQMQLEEASLDSGRYNTDFAAQSRPASAGLLGAFRSTVARLGGEFNLPSPSKLGLAKLRKSATKH